MVELSKERIDKILHEETTKKEDLDTILRAVYTRYMRLYEKYFSDIDALNDDEIAGLKNYHEETRSLIRYYYMDIPQDICHGFMEFEKKYSDRLLGDKWHKYLFDSFKEFREKSRGDNKTREYLKAEFTKQTLAEIYEGMDYVFRDGFGTGSQTVKDVTSGIAGLLFGKEK